MNLANMREMEVSPGRAVSDNISKGKKQGFPLGRPCWSLYNLVVYNNDLVRQMAIGRIISSMETPPCWKVPLYWRWYW